MLYQPVSIKFGGTFFSPPKWGRASSTAMVLWENHENNYSSKSRINASGCNHLCAINLPFCLTSYFLRVEWICRCSTSGSPRRREHTHVSMRMCFISSFECLSVVWCAAGNSKGSLLGYRYRISCLLMHKTVLRSELPATLCKMARSRLVVWDGWFLARISITVMLWKIISAFISFILANCFKWNVDGSSSVKKASVCS